MTPKRSASTLARRVQVRWLPACCVVMLIAACAQQPPAAPGAGPAGASVPAASASASMATPASAPADSGAAAAVIAKPAPTPQELNKLVLTAEELLEAGSEDAARTELQQVLAADPNHKLAQLVLRQLSDDPVARLGSQSYAYTVKPGDSLSKLARQYLGDIHLFYLLARYNGIKVPRQLQEGQVIRLPGKAPVAPASAAPVVPVPAPSVAEPAVPAPPAPPRESEADSLVKRGKVALRATEVERAYELFRQAAKLGQPEAPALAEDARKSLIASYSREARKALARQDLDAALKGWDKVLAIDPGNETALGEQRKVRALKAKADKLAR